MNCTALTGRGALGALGGWGAWSLVAACGLSMSALAQQAVPAKTESQPVPTKQMPPPRDPPKMDPAKQPQPGVSPALSPTLTPHAPHAPAKGAVPDVPSTGGKIEFTGLAHDFGVISDDKTVEYDFTFTNTGTGPLEIVRATGSCGCTVPALAKTTYAPGETGTVKVQYNPNHKRGPQATTVTVVTNDDSARNVALSVKTEVRPMLQVDPEVLSIGEVGKGKSKSMTVTVTSRKQDLSIMGASPTIAALTARVLPGVEAEINGEKVWQYPVEITVPPTAPTGTIQGSVALRTSETGRVVNFAVRGEVMGDVALNPQRVQLQALTPGQTMASTVSLKSRNGRAFKVLEVREQPNGAGSPVFSGIQVKDDASTTPVSYIVTLGGTAPTTGGAMSGTLYITTDLEDEREIKVPYYGFVRATPPKAMTPTLIPSASPSTTPANIQPMQVQPGATAPASSPQQPVSPK